MKARKVGPSRRASLVQTRKKHTKSGWPITLVILISLISTLAVAGFLVWTHHVDTQSALHSMDQSLSSFSTEQRHNNDKGKSNIGDGYNGVDIVNKNAEKNENEPIQRPSSPPYLLMEANCSGPTPSQLARAGRRAKSVGHIEPIVGGKNYGNKVKQELQIVFHSDEYHVTYPSRLELRNGRGMTKHDASRGIMNGTNIAYLEALEALKAHPLHQYPCHIQNNNTQRKDLVGMKPTLEEALHYMQNQPQCKGIPIFLSMAAVGSDLYWQLIENFVYTAVKFEYSDCVMVICVSDRNCVNLCKNNIFPCFDYNSPKELIQTDRKVSVMEQIAYIKLYEIRKALKLGVNVFMLDLDVGFLADPIPIIDTFMTNPIADIVVQEDLVYIMNRTRIGWKTWYTNRLPNIGLFLCKGAPTTVKVFEIAWQTYQRVPAKDRKNPGKDQNCVLDAMRRVRAFQGLKYAYLHNRTAVLVDKMYLANRTVELGGLVAQNLMGGGPTGAFAGHTTCYEHHTKVMGLKAVNAFWNPLYYNPQRPTITKQLIYTDPLSLLDELRSLVWLAFATGRSIIIPNIMGRDDLYSKVGGYEKRTLWPGFRVLKFKKEVSKLTSVLEPAFYWRVDRDYGPVPDPKIIYYNPRIQDIEDIRRIVIAASHEKYPRVVLAPMILPKFLMDHADQNLKEKRSYVLSGSKNDDLRKIMYDYVKSVTTWAVDSVGKFPESFSATKRTYEPLPSVKGLRSMRASHWGGDTGGLEAYNKMLNEFAPAESYLRTIPQIERSQLRSSAEGLLQGMRLCAKMFKTFVGNRSCFDKCD